jgi:hypothetical protein
MSITDDLRPTTIDGIKRLAQRLQAGSSLTRARALDEAALRAGFQNYTHARRVLNGARAQPIAPPHRAASAGQEYRERSRAEWVETIDAVPGAVGAASLSWSDVPSMVEVLRPFMGEGRNHGHFPTGGGHDFVNVRVSPSEPGCLEFQVSRRLVYLGRPLRLRLERIEAEPAESFLYIELADLPESGVYRDDDDAAAPRTKRADEELVDLGGGEYVERGAWDRGFVDYEDDPLPENARLLHRMLRGAIMIVCKASVWNSSARTYGGIHDQMGADGVRQVIEAGLARRQDRPAM